MLESRGQLRYEDAVRKYWPEFRNGNITIADLMRHAGGVAVLDFPLDVQRFRNEIGTAEFDLLLARHAAVRADPGKAAYHALTRGLFTDALVRRVDRRRRSIAQFVQDEIAKPLDIEFYVGSSHAYDVERVAFHHSLPIAALLAQIIPQFVMPHSISDRIYDFYSRHAPPGLQFVWSVLFDKQGAVARSVALTNGDVPYFGAASMANDPVYRDSELISGSSVSNARSLAAIVNELALGGGRLLANPAALQRANAHQHVFDELLGLHTNYTACGWAKDRLAHDLGGAGGWFGWAGAGGSVLQFNPDRQIAFAYVPTYLAPQMRKPRGVKLMRAVEDAVDRIESGQTSNI